ncbi:MAG: methyltransferase domain-containing protein [Saprospiraceae bacterium]|nr:methyltransferase domain-containing protein [Saprospiraceae bacterium]
MKDITQTGSVWESSRFLIRKLLDPVDWSAATTIIELGTGNGVITTSILQRMLPEACMTAYEINADFLELTRHRINADSRCTLTDDSAEYLSDIYPEGSVDAVISSLPFAIMDEELQETILRQIHLVLKPGGQYLQYQYAPTKYRMITRRFKRVRLDYTLLNIPPAFVYSCVK